MDERMADLVERGWSFVINTAGPGKVVCEARLWWRMKERKVRMVAPTMTEAVSKTFDTIKQAYRH